MLLCIIEYLTDQKCRVKKKKAEVTLTVCKTGGGKAEVPDLVAEDEKLLAAMVGTAVVEGDPLIVEFGFGTEVSSSL